MQQKDKAVFEYLKRQKKGQKEIVETLRNLIINNFPLKETAMSEGLWYEGNFYIAAFKDHVNLGVCIEGLSAEEIKHFDGKGKTLRHLKFYSAKEVDKQTLLSLMKVVYEKVKCGHDIVWKHGLK